MYVQYTYVHVHVHGYTLYVHTYVCTVCVAVCICTYVCTYICMYVCLYEHTYIYAYVHMYTYMYVCLYVCLCTYIRMYCTVCAYICTYIYILHINVSLRPLVHVHMHTLSFLVPFLSRLLPSDVCRIYKTGGCIRLDSTLGDFTEMKWSRGDLSFIFNGDDDRNGEGTCLYVYILYCICTFSSGRILKVIFQVVEF